MVTRPVARLLGIIGIVIVVGLLVPAWQRADIGWFPDPRSAHSNSASLTGSPLEPGYTTKNKFTTVLAHAPGFTVFENLYWRNNTYYIVTDQPWAFPAVKVMLSGGARNEDRDVPPPIETLSVRQTAINKHVSEHNQLGATVSPSDAVTFTSSAEDLSSPTLLAVDNHFLGHYYHWVGEMFLGAWRIWNNLALRTGTKTPAFKTIAFSRMYTDEELKKVGLGPIFGWQDHAGANEYFMKAFFPDVVIETKTTWDERAVTGKVYRFPLALLADRFAGHQGPSAGWKPFGDVLRLPVHDNWIADLRQVLLSKYRGPIDVRPSSKLRVSYLTRQDTTRRLTEEAHKALVHEFERLHDEGVISYTQLHFTDGTSFDEQVARMAATDVLVGVHGNGLTHTIWMSPGEGKAVFEIIAKPCSMNDYGPLALAAGVRHWLVREEVGMCEVYDCPERGCRLLPDPFKKGPNRDDLTVDPKLISDKLREMAREYYGHT